MRSTARCGIAVAALALACALPAAAGADRPVAAAGSDAPVATDGSGGAPPEAAPRVALARVSPRVDRSGTFAVEIRCTGAEGAVCSGLITIRRPGPVKHRLAARRPIGSRVLARTSFALEARSAARVEVPLTEEGIATLDRLGRVRVLLTIAPDGGAPPVRRSIVLRTRTAKR
jgi:hypothetical protein